MPPQGLRYSRRTNRLSALGYIHPSSIRYPSPRDIRNGLVPSLRGGFVVAPEFQTGMCISASARPRRISLWRALAGTPPADRELQSVLDTIMSGNGCWLLSQLSRHQYDFPDRKPNVRQEPSDRVCLTFRLYVATRWLPCPYMDVLPSYLSIPPILWKGLKPPAIVVTVSTEKDVR